MLENVFKSLGIRVNVLSKSLSWVEKLTCFLQFWPAIKTSGYMNTAEWNELNPTKNLQYLVEELSNQPVLTANHLGDYLPRSKTD